MYSEYELWPLTESWIERMMFAGTIRINDIPRELRIGCDTFYVAAFRISRNISSTWFVQTLKLLEYDIMSTPKDSSERKQLLDMLSFNLSLGEGKKEVVDYKESMDKETLRELYDRQGANQAKLRAQLEQYRAANRTGTAESVAKKE